MISVLQGAGGLALMLLAAVWVSARFGVLRVVGVLVATILAGHYLGF